MSEPEAPADPVAAEPAPLVLSERLQFVRGVLIAAGVLLLGGGAATFLTDVPPARYPGVAAWLLGAIVLHDGIAAMLVFAATVVIRRFERIVPFVVLAIAQAAIVTVAIVTVLVLPEIVKQAIGSANPSILPLDYVRNLLLVDTAIVALMAVAVALDLVLRRRLRRRLPQQPVSRRTS